MRFETGARGVCKTCSKEIYFSQARDAGDPWVHADWTKNKNHADHMAEPLMQEHDFLIKVKTPVLAQAARTHVAGALYDSEKFDMLIVEAAS